MKKCRSLLLKRSELLDLGETTKDQKGGLASILRHTYLEVLLYVTVKELT